MNNYIRMMCISTVIVLNPALTKTSDDELNTKKLAHKNWHKKNFNRKQFSRNRSTHVSLLVAIAEQKTPTDFKTDYRDATVNSTENDTI